MYFSYEECHCVCHEGKYVHLTACCSPCDLCGKRIRSSRKDVHLEHCEALQSSTPNQPTEGTNMNWKTDARNQAGAFSRVLASAVQDAARGAATATGSALAGERAQGIAQSAVGLAIDTAFGSAQAAASPVGKVAPIILGSQATEVNQGVAKLAEQTQAAMIGHASEKAVLAITSAGEYLQEIGKKKEE